MVELGALVLAAGHLLQMAVAASGGGVAVMWLPLLVEGAGIGFVMAPLVSLALSRLPSQHAGVAAGILSTMQSTGNALGVAVVGFFYIAGLWLPAGLELGHTRFVEALILLAVLALAVWLPGAAHPRRSRQSGVTRAGGDAIGVTPTPVSASARARLWLALWRTHRP